MTMDPDADFESEYGETTTDCGEETIDCSEGTTDGCEETNGRSEEIDDCCEEIYDCCEETDDCYEETDDCTYCLYRGDLEDKIPDKCTLTNGQSCQACGRQSELLKQIEATKKLLDRLILEELEMRVEINRLHDPIHRLPPEITSHIFRFTLPDFALQEKTENWPADRGLPSETWVFTLGAVCQRWRDIAWSTPDLWSNVMMTLNSEPTPNKITLFQEWLERSKQLPLSIRLYLSEDCCWMKDRRSIISPQIRAFGVLVKNHSARWKDLSLQCNDMLLTDFTRDAYGAPLLKTLQLIPRYSNHGYGRAEFSIDGVMPQPDHVVLLGFERSQDVDILWYNVTDLTIDRLLVGDCIHLLIALPELVKVRFQDIRESGYIPDSDSDDSSDGNSDVPIPVRRVLYHLRTLYISSSVSFATILDIMVLPSLEELSINGNALRAWDAISLDSELAGKIVELLERSSCLLTSFSFEQFRCHEQELIDILYSLPSSVNDLQLDVQSLSVFRIRNSFRSVFDHLARAPTATIRMPSRAELLPNLETLKHQVYRDGPIPWDRLPNLLRPMSGNPRPFKKLTIVHRDHVDGPPRLILSKRKIKRSEILDLIELMDNGVDLFLTRRVSSQDLLALLED